MRTATALLYTMLVLLPIHGNERPAWNPETADLLLTSGRDGNSEIYILRGDKREWINLTNDKGGDNWPVWSPDGTRIAFQSNRKGNLDIWTMKADGSEQAQLTNDPEPDYLPAWSADGKMILFTSWRREKRDEKRSPHIYVTKVDGSDQRRLVAESLESSSGATWSPDRKRIVYSRSTSKESSDIFVADRKGKGEQRLTHDEDLYNGSPIFSPDGSQIAFYSDNGTSSALVVMHPDGTRRRTVLAEGKNWYPRWSPDGRWLVYTAAVPGGNKGNTDIFAISVEGGSPPMLLAGGVSRELEGSWRPRP